MDESKSVAQEVLLSEFQSLRARVTKLERELAEQARVKLEAAELQRWKQLVPAMKRYYP